MLSKNEIKHIAELARIGVSEKEIEKYQHNLSEMVDYFKKLEELDTKNVEPIEHITGRNSVFRKDENKDITDENRDSIIKNAPEIKDGYVKVKSVL